MGRIGVERTMGKRNWPNRNIQDITFLQFSAGRRGHGDYARLAVMSGQSIREGSRRRQLIRVTIGFVDSYSLAYVNHLQLCTRAVICLFQGLATIRRCCARIQDAHSPSVANLSPA